MHLTSLLIIKSIIICNIIIFVSAKANETTAADSGNGGFYNGAAGAGELGAPSQASNKNQLDSEGNFITNLSSNLNNRLDKPPSPPPPLPPPQPPPSETPPAPAQLTSTIISSTTLTSQLTTTSSPPSKLQSTTITTTTTHPSTTISPTKRRPPHPCPGLHIRNDLKSFDALRGCTVIEGSLTIALISNQKNPYEPKDYENITFPDLIEIKDYLLFFRVEGLSTLSKLFPNLAVIKGKALFADYALIIYEMMNLQKIDLPKLADILHGSVRIENNPNLCYVTTVNWDGICKNSFKHFIKDNNNRCNNNCPNSCKHWKTVKHATHEIQGDIKELGAENDRSLFCWSGQQCHDTCQLDDGTVLPLGPNGSCCSPQCAGGCYMDNKSDECYSCRLVEQEGKCVETCQTSLYEYKDQCISEQSCIMKSNQVSMRENQCNPLPEEKTQPANFKAIRARAPERHGRCQQTCPTGYEEDPNNKNKCKPCDKGKCRKVCTADLEQGKPFSVTNVNSVRELQGCNVINGSLEISMKGGRNVLEELQKAFQDLEEITGYLKITRSYPLVTLGFLSKLKVINGTELDRGQYSLIIIDNPNLQELFMFNTSDTNQKQLKIYEGKIFVHLNSKLCPHRIDNLKTYASVAAWDERDVSIHTNGDKELCNTQKLQLSTKRIHSRSVLIEFQNFALSMDDSRLLLYYLINYREAENGTVSMFDGRDGCNSQNDLWTTIEEPPAYKRGDETQEAYVFLKPATRYALYVKTFTISAGSTGAISDIIYFNTAPDTPGIPREVESGPIETDKITVSWAPPSKPNGIIERYFLTVTKQAEFEDFQDLDICSSIGKRDQITKSISQHESNSSVMTPRQQTSQISSSSSSTSSSSSSDEFNPNNPSDKMRGCRLNSDIDPDIQVDKNSFQDKIIDIVYLKQPCATLPKPSKRRRSIDHEYNSLSFDAPSQSSFASLSSQKIVPEQQQRNTIESVTNTINTSTKSPQTPKLIDSNHPDKPILFYDSNQPKLESNITANLTEAEQKNPINKRHEVTISKLHHFSLYEIKIVACHKDYNNEKKFILSKSYNKCSISAVKIVRTQPKAENDHVPVNSTYFIPANETSSEHMVSWSKPTSPNGLIFAFRIRYRLKNGPPDVWTESCINVTTYDRDRGFNLTNVLPGSYIFGIQTVSMYSGGRDSWTEVEFEIPNNYWVSPIVLTILILIGVMLLVFFVGSGTYYYQKRKHELIYASVNPDYEQYKPDEWEIDKSNLEIGLQIGTGSFGLVYKGLLKTSKGTLNCAVKTIAPTSTAKQRFDFLREASIMKQFDTYHVVKLMGVISSTTPVYVIMEFMENGDLKSFLRSQRELHQKEKKLLVDGIYLMAAQIADGMAYLASKKFVHRDLAARNCMVGENRVVKIGDFGLTRDIYANDYYRKGTQGRLPVRWMAPESLSDNLYTSASDVWSYGIVVWEMVTFSAYPYQGQSNDEVIKRVISGFKMSRPDNCTDKLYNIMERCWRKNSSDRPTFNDIVEYILPETGDKLYPNCFYKKETKIESDSIAQPGTVIPEEDIVTGAESYPLLSYPSNRANGLTNGMTVVNQTS